MCIGFGTIVTKNLDVFFTLWDAGGDISHHEIIEALRLKENENMFMRGFVRTESQNWTEERFRFDEMDTLPGWAEENKTEITEKVNRLMNRVMPIYEKSMKWKKESLLESMSYHLYLNAKWDSLLERASEFVFDKTKGKKFKRKLRRELRKIPGFVE